MPCVTCVCVCTHVCSCVHVCARACMNNEIDPFSRLLLSHYIHKTYIFVQFLSFLSCGIMVSLFLCAGDVMNRGAFDLCIKSRLSIFT